MQMVKFFNILLKKLKKFLTGVIAGDHDNQFWEILIEKIGQFKGNYKKKKFRKKIFFGHVTKLCEKISDRILR